VLTNTNTNVEQRTKTNGEGIYVFASVQPGLYSIAVGSTGFKTLIKENLVLHTQDEVAENFALGLGSVSESVTVNGNAEHMATDDPAVGLLVDRTFVENIPLNGRSFQDLIALAPGAVSSSDTGGLFSINGQRDDANNFTVDGVSANTNTNVSSPTGLAAFAGLAGDYPSQTVQGTTQSLASLDTLQEFKIQTAGYSAEYGRQPGGQVEIVTRSGENDFHGSMFDYFRNEALDANSWVNKSESLPRDPERQNDFGGTIGGPVRVPHYYDGKDRTFFFFSYEGLRLELPGSGIAVVPSIAFRQGAAPALQPFLNAFPLPNRGPAEGQSGDIFAASFANPSNINNYSVRLDHNVGGRVQIFGRFAQTFSNQTTIAATAAAFAVAQNAFTLTGGLSAKLSNSLDNELRLNYSKDRISTHYYPIVLGGSVPYPASLLLLPQYMGPSAGYGAQISFGGFNDLDGNPVGFYPALYSYNSSAQHSMNIVDSFGWTKARHALKFGGDLRRLSPIFSPITDYTVPSVNTLSDYQQGNASFLFTEGGTGAKPVFDAFSLFVNDTWRIGSRFTLIYGLRWEFNPVPGPYDEKYPIAVDQTNNLATMQIAPPGTPPYQTRYKNFAPRLGLAWQLFASHTHPLVLRAGAGIFYDTGQNLAAAGYNGFPFFNFASAAEVPFPLSTAELTPPGPAPLVPPYQFINAISDPHLRLPYTEEWNVAVDYGLSSRNTLTLNYVGNAGKQLLFTEQASPTYNPDFSAGFNLVTNAAASKYEALQIQDQGQITKGMAVIESYTWAHARDSGSTDNGVSSASGVLFLAPQWGNSDNDIRQILNLALNYDIPSASSHKRVVNAFTKGWLVAGRFSVQSGLPFSVIQTTSVLPGTNISILAFPDLVPGQPIYEHGVPGITRGWELNPNAFQLVPTDPTTGLPIAPGTAYRNEFHGPSLWGFNPSVQRRFDIHERLGLTFRVDAFNLFNHANLTSVNNYLYPGNSTFGQIVVQGIGATTLNSSNPLYAWGAARSLQLSLKLNF
jgi:hypothetical protein